MSRPAGLLRRELHCVRGPSADVRRLGRRDVRVLRQLGQEGADPGDGRRSVSRRLPLSGRKVDPIDRVRRRVVDRRLALLPDDLHVTRVRLQLEPPAAVVAHPEPPGCAGHQRGTGLAHERSVREQPVRETDAGRDARGLGGGEPLVNRGRKRLARGDRAGSTRCHRNRRPADREQRHHRCKSDETSSGERAEVLHQLPFSGPQMRKT